MNVYWAVWKDDLIPSAKHYSPEKAIHSFPELTYPNPLSRCPAFTKYFENTLVHMFGNDCNSKCRQEIIKSETDYAVVLILKLISTELHQKLLILERKVYD